MDSIIEHTGPPVAEDCSFWTCPDELSDGVHSTPAGPVHLDQHKAVLILVAPTAERPSELGSDLSFDLVLVQHTPHRFELILVRRPDLALAKGAVDSASVIVQSTVKGALDWASSGALVKLEANAEPLLESLSTDAAPTDPVLGTGSPVERPPTDAHLDQILGRLDALDLLGSGPLPLLYALLDIARLLDRLLLELVPRAAKDAGPLQLWRAGAVLVPARHLDDPVRLERPVDAAEEVVEFAVRPTRVFVKVDPVHQVDRRPLLRSQPRVLIRP